MGYLQAVASSASEKIGKAWTGFRYAGTGRVEDPIAGHLNNRIKARSVDLEDAHNDTDIPCEYGFHVHGDVVHSCIAQSKQYAQDGCQYLGRQATCQDGSKNLTACGQDFYLLSPECNEFSASYVGLQATSAVAAGVGLLWLGGKVLSKTASACSSIYNWCAKRGEYTVNDDLEAQDTELMSLKASAQGRKALEDAVALGAAPESTDAATLVQVVRTNPVKPSRTNERASLIPKTEPELTRTLTH